MQNLDKYEFGKREITFLGHLVTADGIRPLPEKVALIRDFPKPIVAKELKRFLAMINFYKKFLPQAVKHQSQLLKLIKGNVKNDNTPIIWTQEADDCFDLCKKELMDATTLAHPVKNAKLALYVDASDTAVGAALHQCVNGNLQPLGFYSKKLTPSQRNYSTYDRELTAIYQGVCYFRYMLEGRDCYVVTDHRPLTYAFNQKLEKASPRRARQLDFIGQFTTDIRYIPGFQNVAADLFSRIQAVTQNINYQKIAAAQGEDPELRQLKSGTISNSLILKSFAIPDSDHALVCDTSTQDVRPYIPSEFRNQVMSMVHDLAHPGVRATIKLMTKRFIWPGIKKDTAKFVRNCLACQRSKVHRHIKSPVEKYVPPVGRFSHINVDIVGPFPLCEGQRYCLTIIDRYTRWPEAVPMPDMAAETVAKALLYHWISRFGVPARITSDRGRQFESAIFAELMTTIGTTHLRTTPYHPQSNGIIERWHRVFKAAILCNDPAKWIYNLPSILLGLRVVYKPDIKASPAELVYGTTLRLPGEFFSSNNSSEVTSEMVSQFKASMQRLQPTDTSHHSQKKAFVSTPLKLATHVFVRNDSIRPSLSHPYDGPYPVKRKGEKFFNVIIRDKAINISIDRLKPAFFASSDIDPNTTFCAPHIQATQNDSKHFSPEKTTTSKLHHHFKTLNMRKTDNRPPSPHDIPERPAKTTKSGRHVILPARFR